MRLTQGAVGGLLLFTVASAACALAPSGAALIAARAVKASARPRSRR
jgi:predicted MFS family arabinose efflux permease